MLPTATQGDLGGGADEDDGRCLLRSVLPTRYLIAGSFAEVRLAGLDSVQLEQFEALLACPDPDLLDWIVNGIAPPPEHDHDVMRLLRGFRDAQQRRSQLCAQRQP
jgi:succinate dehydrogenase flavin-adding protein (antitoxin of CptAB toxin-antitoxin module)